MSIAVPVAEPHVNPPPPPDSLVGANGRLRDARVTDIERNFAVAMHLSPLAFVFIGPLALVIPLVLWLVRKDHSTFNDDHGRETVNFLISYLLWMLLFCWTIIIPVVLVIVGIVNMIRGAVAAGSGEYFRYPMTVRFIS
jgi:uncharacterized Tic20 family protein